MSEAKRWWLIGVGLVIVAALVLNLVVLSRTDTDVAFQSPTDPSGPATTSVPLPSSSVTVHEASETTLELAGGARLTVPAGAMAEGTIVTASYSGVPLAPKMLSAVAPPVKLETNPPNAIRAPVNLDFPVASDAPSTVRKYDDAERRWVAVDAAYLPETRTLRVATNHFSFWGEFRDALLGRLAQDAGQVGGTRIGLPECKESDKRSNTLPSWANLAASLNANDPVPACGQAEGDVLAVEFTNNRSYGIVIPSKVPLAWTYAEAGTSLHDLLRDAIVDGVTDGIYVPALSKASVGIPRGDWPRADFQAEVSGYAVAVDLLATLISLAAKAKAGSSGTLGKVAKFMTGECVSMLWKMQIPSDLSAARDDLITAAKCAYNALVSANQHGVDFAHIKDVATALEGLTLIGAAQQVDKWISLYAAATVSNTGGFSVDVERRTTRPSSTTSTSAAPPCNSDSLFQATKKNYVAAAAVSSAQCVGDWAIGNIVWNDTTLHCRDGLRLYHYTSGRWTVASSLQKSNADVASETGAPINVVDQLLSLPVTCEVPGSEATDAFATSLLTAWVPSLCQHPAGNLVNGSLPGIPENQGAVGVDVKTIKTGDLTGDGKVDAAVVANCNQGGIGWPPSVLIYGPGATYIALVELTQLDQYATGRPYIDHLTVADGHLTIDFTTAYPGENDLWPTRKATGRVHLAGSKVVVDGVS